MSLRNGDTKDVLYSAHSGECVGQLALLTGRRVYSVFTCLLHCTGACTYRRFWPWVNLPCSGRFIVYRYTVQMNSAHSGKYVGQLTLLTGRRVYSVQVYEVQLLGLVYVHKNVAAQRSVCESACLAHRLYCTVQYRCTVRYRCRYVQMYSVARV